MDTAQGIISQAQVHELIDIVRKVHGFDFAGYTKASFKTAVNPYHAAQ